MIAFLNIIIAVLIQGGAKRSEIFIWPLFLALQLCW